MDDLQKSTCNEANGKGASKHVEMQDSPANSHAVRVVLPVRQVTKKISKLDVRDDFNSARHQASVTELANRPTLGLTGPSSQPEH